MLMKTYEIDHERTDKILIFKNGAMVEELAAPVVRYGCLFSPEIVLPDTKSAFDSAVEMVMRIAPWVNLVMSPAAWLAFDPADDDTGYPMLRRAKTKDEMGVIQEWQGIGGVYYRLHNLVVVGYGRRMPDTMLQTAAHEAFHAIDAYLPKKYQQIIDAAIGPGLCPGLPAAPGQRRYWPSQVERRARAFEAWTANYIAGFARLGRGRSRANDDYTFDELMNFIWTGEMADYLMNLEEAA